RQDVGDGCLLGGRRQPAPPRRLRTRTSPPRQCEEKQCSGRVRLPTTSTPTRPLPLRPRRLSQRTTRRITSPAYHPPPQLRVVSPCPGLTSQGLSHVLNRPRRSR